MTNNIKTSLKGTSLTLGVKPIVKGTVKATRPLNVSRIVNFGNKMKSPKATTTVVKAKATTPIIPSSKPIVKSEVSPKVNTVTTGLKGPNSTVIKRLSNVLRKSGKRSIANKIIEDTATYLKKNGYAQPYSSITKAIDTLKPRVELRSQKKSGQSIQIPYARTENRQEGMALRRLKDAAQKRKASSSSKFADSLGLEIINILKGDNSSQALNKRDTLHRRAIAQRGARR